MVANVRLHPSWLEQVGREFAQPYMQSLRAFLAEQREAGKSIYPRASLWFNALDATPFDKVKVVILGQDPYHGPGQAHGLCFSVPRGVRPPPSLLNMFKEIKADLELPGSPFEHGCLESWAAQGVLMLNSVLTVEKSRAASHQGKGWETFTDIVVQRLAEAREGIVFMLWGAYAQKKGDAIDPGKHLVLQARHPSPLSANGGFFGCRHFSKCDAYLESRGESGIDWARLD